MHDPVVIVSYARTAIGAFRGVFSDFKATELGRWAIKGCLNKLPVKINIDEVLMGCVLTAGLGQAPARQAAIYAGLPPSTLTTTVNKVCGSGMQSIIFAHKAIALSTCDVVIAGGMESMTNAPYLLPNARNGYKFGHGNVLDHMVYDGLEDAYERGRVMGDFAEDTAQHYGFSRKQQDEFAKNSFNKAIKSASILAKEITTVQSSSGANEISQDEWPEKVKIEKIPELKPVFRKDGTITAASASSLADGAAALVLMRESKARELNLTPKAKIIAYSSFAQDPCFFITSPIGSIRSVLNKAQWSIEDVDLYEINEAFAVVTMATISDLKIDPKKVNVHGGACALGHPLGDTGTRIVVTLINALEHYGLKKGIASLCVGGGEALALAIEVY